MSPGQSREHLHVARGYREIVGRPRKRILRYGRLRGSDEGREGDERGGCPMWIACLLVMAWALLFGAMLLLVWLGRVGLL